MNRWAVCGVALLFSLGMAPSAWAGAWTLPRNRWYVEYFYRYFGSKQTFDQGGDSGRRPSAGFFSDIRNELKLEYGLTDWWTFLASVPYISSHYRDDNVDLLRTGVQDIYLRHKFRIWNRPVFAPTPLVASAQLSFKIPAYQEEKNPLGDGQFDVESRLQLSQAWLFSPASSPGPSAQAETVIAPPRRLASLPEARSEPMTREDAIRSAFLEAELMRKGVRRYNAGNYEEAAKWFQAVLEQDPAHAEVQRIVLNHAARVMQREAQRRGEPILVGEDALEPMFEHEAGADGAHTRYTKVAFVNVEGGFTARADAPANEFPTFLEAGFTPFTRLMLIGSLDSVVSVNSTNEDEENFSKWGLRGILNLWGDGFASVFRNGGPTVNFEVGYNDIFAGRNTADAFEIFGKLGVFF